MDELEEALAAGRVGQEEADLARRQARLAGAASLGQHAAPVEVIRRYTNVPENGA